MTETLGADLLRHGPDDGDWSDVLRRATRARRRRQTSAVGALVAAVAVGIASAYAFGHAIIDFGKAEKGPVTIVNDFGSLEVGAPEGMAPGVLPHEARRITSVFIDGKEHVLWVAPTKQGGFCEQWSDFFGGCRADRRDEFAKRIGVSAAVSAAGINVLGGSFFQSAGARLKLSYADGTSDEIPFVWVSAPIEAGFYLYRVPDPHRVIGHRPTALSLFDDRGKMLAREPVLNVAASLAAPVTHSLPGFPLLPVPAEAIWEQRQQLFDLRADDGAHIGLWIAPERGGGTCFWSNQASGCPHGREDAEVAQPALALSFSGAATHVALCCTVGPRVDRVEARFQDGDRAELTPRQGYLIWPIPSQHYPPGQRLDRLIAFDATGRQIASQKMPADQRGLYPCAKPEDYGYGVSMCP
ncbi:MAG: hypothetical protein M3R26_01040 [Actinomycetota bacterium]|nr:hypothetical protein [Actinomycetota bacterium]